MSIRFATLRFWISCLGFGCLSFHVNTGQAQNLNDPGFFIAVHQSLRGHFLSVKIGGNEFLSETVTRTDTFRFPQSRVSPGDQVDILFYGVGTQIEVPRRAHGMGLEYSVSEDDFYIYFLLDRSNSEDRCEPCHTASEIKFTRLLHYLPPGDGGFDSTRGFLLNPARVTLEFEGNFAPQKWWIALKGKKVSRKMFLEADLDNDFSILAEKSFRPGKRKELLVSVDDQACCLELFPSFPWMVFFLSENGKGTIYYWNTPPPRD